MGLLRFFQTLAFGLVCCSGVLQGYAAVGREAPDFHAKDLFGQECSLSQYKGKIVVLEWTDPKCPYVKKQYSKDTNDGVGNMQAMQKRFTQQSVGVIWIMIASSATDKNGYLSPDGWKAQLQQWGAQPTALIIDDSGHIANLYGAQRAPEVMVIGKDGTLLYRGAVDSLRGTDPAEIEQFNNLPWLKNAIEKAIQDRRVVPPETIPYGCPIR
jgi:alkyl hydroperoxide reductase subunit AhpC